VGKEPHNLSPPHLVGVVAFFGGVLSPILLPFLAWKGRPRGFTRLNWAGVAIGASIFFAIFLVEAIVNFAPEVKSQIQSFTVEEEALGTKTQQPDGSFAYSAPLEEGGQQISEEEYSRSVAEADTELRAVDRAEDSLLDVQLIARLFGAIAIGALLALFFYRTGA
jgi:hypothetical protein